MTTKNIIQYSGAGILLLGLAAVYWTFDPAGSGFFPPCPFHSLTGLLCPGCGSQRAVHHLLHLELMPAWNQNPLLVVSIPYILIGFGFDHIWTPAGKMLKWRERLYGKKAIMVVLAIVLLFWLLRNLITF
ncbi:DUF2752 domain-containing protein [Salinimicrobium soli]|uniref:DUF2752 domain-containing protein n=1 Tax=Salinimicrobium soli TaxID=1254399 RepID=UPI003AAD99C2